MFFIYFAVPFTGTAEETDGVKKQQQTLRLFYAHGRKKKLTASTRLHTYTPDRLYKARRATNKPSLHNSIPRGEISL